MRIKIGSKLLWYNKIALEIERIIGMQDVIHCSNFFEHWNKGHSDFEQSSTNNLGPGNGVVRCPGDKVIILVLGLDCVSSRMTWVNRLYDYKDGRLREWKKCFLIALCSLARKEILWWKFSISGEQLWNQESGRLLLKSEASRSNREGWNVWSYYSSLKLWILTINSIDVILRSSHWRHSAKIFEYIFFKIANLHSIQLHLCSKSTKNSTLVKLQTWSLQL